jgi:hypothetical protein
MIALGWLSACSQAPVYNATPGGQTNPCTLLPHRTYSAATNAELDAEVEAADPQAVWPQIIDD